MGADPPVSACVKKEPTKCLFAPLQMAQNVQGSCQICRMVAATGALTFWKRASVYDEASKKTHLVKANLESWGGAATNVHPVFWGGRHRICIFNLQKSKSQNILGLLPHVA